MQTVSYYVMKNHNYYFHIGREIRFIGQSISIGFTIHSNYKKATLHKHGNVDSVMDWFDKSIAKIIQADALGLTEDVKMLVFSDIDPEEINKIVHRPDYLGRWIEDNDVKV